MTRNLGGDGSSRIPSRRFTWPVMFVDSVSAGVCHEAATKLCAARWMIWVGALAASSRRTDALSRRSHSTSWIFPRRCSMFSVRLRHARSRMTSAPWASAYSAMWLPTNPVIPVMSSRMGVMLQEPRVGWRVFWSWFPVPARRAVDEKRSGQDDEASCPLGLS